MQTGGRPMTATTVRALVIAAMERHAPHMLAANGEIFSFGEWHAYTTLAKRCHVHADRKAKCDTYKRPPNWEELVGDMNARIAVTIVAKGVKPELFYSMDETFV
eukprot:362407-Chlamydomonas_euryale.AAC.1